MAGVKVQSIRLLALFLGIAASAAPALAKVGGNVSVDSTGFMREAAERPEFLAAITLAPYGDFETSVIHARIEILTMLYVNQLASFSPEGPQAYIATHENLMGGRHQFTLGRRILDWSAMEKGMNFLLSSWSPRFGWDPYNPTQVGLTGLFYTYKYDKFRLIAHATPFGIPERGAPTGSPWVTPNPESVEAMGRQVPLRYDLSRIDYVSLIFRPGAALSLQYGDETGPWARGNYGIMPSHMVNAGVNAKLDPISDEIQASIFARGLHDQLLTFEAGWNESLWSTWISANHVAPVFVPKAPPSHVMSPVGNGTIIAVGGELRLKEGVSFQK